MVKGDLGLKNEFMEFIQNICYITLSVLWSLECSLESRVLSYDRPTLPPIVFVETKVWN